MRHEIENVIALIESRCQARQTPMEFEMAYQARVAIDRIRFAIKHTEHFAPHTDPMREAGLQLLDALERLEAADRRFQRRSASRIEESAKDGVAEAKSSEVLRGRPPNGPNGGAGKTGPGAGNTSKLQTVQP